MWEVLQRWVLALPVATPEQRTRRLTLQKELEWVVGQLDDGVGIGEDGVRQTPPPPPPSRRPNPGFPVFPPLHSTTNFFFLPV
jgi:hypothetical protein